MSSPIFEVPEHFPIGVDTNGNGPVDEDDPEFDRITCWCPDPKCHGFWKAT